MLDVEVCVFRDAVVTGPREVVLFGRAVTAGFWILNGTLSKLVEENAERLDDTVELDILAIKREDDDDELKLRVLETTEGDGVHQTVGLALGLERIRCEVGTGLTDDEMGDDLGDHQIIELEERADSDALENALTEGEGVHHATEEVEKLKELEGVHQTSELDTVAEATGV